MLREDNSSSFHILQHREKCYCIHCYSTRALFCFSLTMDENNDTVHLIEGFVLE